MYIYVYYVYIIYINVYYVYISDLLRWFSRILIFNKNKNINRKGNTLRLIYLNIIHKQSYENIIN